MVNRRISKDLKEAAIKLYLRGYLELPVILECCGLSRATFFRALKLYRETGEVARPRAGLDGRPRKLHQEDLQYILSLVRARPDFFLDEILKLLTTNRFISVHFTTIFDELERAGMSRKKLQIIAQERNKAVRNDFIRHMAQYTQDQIAFIDETSKDERTFTRRWGRAKKGRRGRIQGKFVRGRRVSATGCMSIHGMVSVKVVEGSMKRDMFLRFLEEHVVRNPSSSRFESLHCLTFQL